MPTVRKPKKKAATEPTPTVAYKALNADFKCRGFQYAVGKTYKHDGKIVLCESGFHACANPLDVWKYDDITSCRYALVEMRGEQKTHDEDSKIASAEITIKAELKLPEIVKSAVAFVLDLCKASKYKSVQASEKKYAQLAASGYSAKLAASGDSAQLAASGYSAQLAASGDSAKLAASGDYSVIASSSYNAAAKGALGTWISLAEFNDEGKCIGFATGCVNGEDIPADVWLKAKNGKLIVVK